MKELEERVADLPFSEIDRLKSQIAAFAEDDGGDLESLDDVKRELNKTEEDLVQCKQDISVLNSKKIAHDEEERAMFSAIQSLREKYLKLESHQRVRGEKATSLQSQEASLESKKKVCACETHC